MVLSAAAPLPLPGVQDHSACFYPVTDAQRMSKRIEGLAPDLRVVAPAIDQVDGVDEDRLDSAPGQLGASRLEVVGRVFRGPPRSRALVEDLHRLAAQILGALDGPLESAR